mmetsp:Transcript_77346/g.169182  ORF Transcript_77346/g.169182 Transcript_77346/m.169182 type:complete len:292 (+) Transcript_77346:1336-2211(+)
MSLLPPEQMLAQPLHRPLVHCQVCGGGFSAVLRLLALQSGDPAAASKTSCFFCSSCRHALQKPKLHHRVLRWLRLLRLDLDLDPVLHLHLHLHTHLLLLGHARTHLHHLHLLHLHSWTHAGLHGRAHTRHSTLAVPAHGRPGHLGWTLLLHHLRSRSREVLLLLLLGLHLGWVRRRWLVFLAQTPQENVDTNSHIEIWRGIGVPDRCENILCSGRNHPLSQRLIFQGEEFGEGEASVLLHPTLMGMTLERAHDQFDAVASCDLLHVFLVHAQISKGTASLLDNSNVVGEPL